LAEEIAFEIGHFAHVKLTWPWP